MSSSGAKLLILPNSHREEKDKTQQPYASPAVAALYLLGKEAGPLGNRHSAAKSTRRQISLSFSFPYLITYTFFFSITNPQAYLTDLS